MELINLSKISKHKFNNTILTKYGGFKQGLKGTSGFTHISGLDQSFSSSGILDPHTINLEFYKEGLGIYFRNIHHNYLLLSTFNDIIKITISKDYDLYEYKKYSFFNFLINAKVPFTYARYFVLENQIKLNNNYILEITYNNRTSIKLTITSFKVKSLINLMHSISSKLKANIKVNTFKYI
jgi:hypothetical protein